jgi:hypothetical protein
MKSGLFSSAYAGVMQEALKSLRVERCENPRDKTQGGI